MTIIYHRGHRGKYSAMSSLRLGAFACNHLTTRRNGAKITTKKNADTHFDLLILSALAYIQLRRNRRMKQSYYIVALPGDGIGPEVLSAALRVLNLAGELFHIDFR